MAQHAAQRADEHEGPDGIELIRRLAQLRDEGLITDEQFDAKRVEIIGRL